MMRARLASNLYCSADRNGSKLTFESNVRKFFSFRSVFESAEGINTSFDFTRAHHFVHRFFKLGNTRIFQNGWKSKESESEKGEPFKTSQSEERWKERQKEECWKTTTHAKGNLWWIHLSSAQASPSRCWHFHQSDEHYELLRQRPLRPGRLRSVQTCEEQDHVVT